MRIRTWVSLFLLAAATSLSGCLAVNMALGAGGLLLGGPVQYAGMAYSVGEYTYQYGVNGKTPVAVMGEKLAFLSPDRQAADSQKVRRVTPKKISPPVLPASDTVRAAAEPEPFEKASVSAADAVGPAISSAGRATVSRSDPARTERKTSRPDFPLTDSAKALQASTPVRSTSAAATLAEKHVAPVIAASNLTRLQRVELRFRELDRDDSGRLLRLLLPERSSGINGGWQIRHALNQQPVSR